MDIVGIIIALFLLVVSLGIHEAAHAWAAHKFGDDTAKNMGRMTINPIPHIDPIGLVPILIGVPFGWAKPVPVNPNNIQNQSLGLPLIAAAGPLSNLAQMLLACLAWFVIYNWIPLPNQEVLRALWDIFEKYISINLALALFNMFPVYPLDGSKVISLLMPENTARQYEFSIMRMGYFPLLLLFLANFALNGQIFNFWFSLWMPLFRPIFNLLNIPF